MLEIRRKSYSDHYVRFILRTGPLRGILNLFLVFFIAVVISLIRIKVIHLLGGQALPLLEPIIWAAVGALPSTGPNGAESSSTWEEDPFELDVLEESFSTPKRTRPPPRQGSPRRKRVNPR
ncbi:hypothetical protein Bca52824_064355 [Brassica carinata]|uniref:Uncharacterized protein n=1 Tax=Brassica carinata TaxID=52824 RepID=A0A8X7QJL3_BRACI|nr:hypothetical protein Bca52824_064355 [Brassica carinata]